jgi:hypothetical protein
MAYDPKVEKQLNQLQAMPREFRALAEWGWAKLRNEIYTEAVKNGADPQLARVMAARLSRLVVSQMYGDISRARSVTPINHG